MFAFWTWIIFHAQKMLCDNFGLTCFKLAKMLAEKIEGISLPGSCAPIFTRPWKHAFLLPHFGAYAKMRDPILTRPNDLRSKLLEFTSLTSNVRLLRADRNETCLNGHKFSLQGNRTPNYFQGTIPVRSISMNSVYRLCKWRQCKGVGGSSLNFSVRFRQTGRTAEAPAL